MFIVTHKSNSIPEVRHYVNTLDIRRIPTDFVSLVGYKYNVGKKEVS